MCHYGHRNNSKRYNYDFQKMIVELYNTGSSDKDLSSEYGVSDVTIYAWIKKFTPIEMEDRFSVTPDDYAKLQTEMRHLKKENEILKKSMTIFARK
ncbi:transposase [Oceanobacillus chungangensis]|uniref:transposase n=1 Tax=Oceanobacillus chungangensis TaxID=1229152 RepID=UPI003CCC51A4